MRSGGAEAAHLIEVERQAVVRIGEHTQILRNFLFGVLHLVKHEERYEALAFRVLSDIQRHVDIHHAGQHPSHASLRIAHQPPVFERRTGSSFSRLGQRRLDGGSSARQLLVRSPAPQNCDLRSGCKLVQVFAVASRGDVHVGVVAQNTGCLHRIILMFLREFLQSVVSFLID